MEMNFSALSLLEMKLGLHITHLKPNSRAVKGEVEKWTKGLAGNYFEEGIKKLIPRFTTCIERNCDCRKIGNQVIFFVQIKIL